MYSYKQRLDFWVQNSIALRTPKIGLVALWSGARLWFSGCKDNNFQEKKQEKVIKFEVLLQILREILK